jgi:hypothetical protein
VYDAWDDALAAGCWIVLSAALAVFGALIAERAFFP